MKVTITTEYDLDDEKDLMSYLAHRHSRELLNAYRVTILELQELLTNKDLDTLTEILKKIEFECPDLDEHKGVLV